MKPKDLIIIPCPVKDVRWFIETNHYSKNINGVKITQCFKITHNQKLVGAVLFGQMSTTAWKKFGESESEVLELRRLVLLDECGKNSESYVVGFCLRWIYKKIPSVKTIVSYADPMHGHSGIIYKAANFTFSGRTSDDKGYYDPENGKTYHSRALRTKYKGQFKPFVKKLREKLRLGILEPITLKGKYCYIYKFKQRPKRLRCLQSNN